VIRGQGSGVRKAPWLRVVVSHPFRKMRVMDVAPGLVRTQQASGLRGRRAAVDFGLLFTKFSSGRTFTSNSQVANEFR
jgi:hypothetical protein